jgi:hypothetical protein
MLVKTFKYRLYPTQAQEERLEETLETCRRWYNTCLAERKVAWEDERRRVGKYEQLAKVKEYRKEDPYAGKLHRHVLQVVVQDLDKAYQAFFRRVKTGETPGYPRFKGRNRFDSFGLKEYGDGSKAAPRSPAAFPEGHRDGVVAGECHMCYTLSMLYPFCANSYRKFVCRWLFLTQTWLGKIR